MSRQLGSCLLAHLQRAVGRQPYLALPAGLALYSTESQAPEDVSEVVRALTCQQFLEKDLAPLRAQTSAVPHSQLLELAQSTGLTASAAEDVISRLERSGTLLNLAGTVLLRPGEVADALSLVLPRSPNDTQQQLAVAQQELQQLEDQQAQIGRQAVWRQRGLVLGGFVAQASLWAVLFRLTFYELSWDVMEPICFFVGGAQAMLCYLYFMNTRTEFSWEGALQRYVGRWEAARLQQAGFDGQRYARLRREVARLTELLAAQQVQQASAQPADPLAAEGKKEA